LLLAACKQAAPPSTTGYILTVQSDGNCTTNPAGAVSVEPGAATSISAQANAGHIWGAWTVTSGTASIANANDASTTVTLNTGSATVQANAAP
jgi:hypothetical protein